MIHPLFYIFLKKLFDDLANDMHPLGPKTIEVDGFWLSIHLNLTTCQNLDLRRTLHGN